MRWACLCCWLVCAGCAASPQAAEEVEAAPATHDCAELNEHEGHLCRCDVERMHEQMQRIEEDLAEIQEIQRSL